MESGRLADGNPDPDEIGTSAIGTARGEIVQPLDYITSWMPVAVLKRAAYDGDERSSCIDGRLTRFRVL